MKNLGGHMGVAGSSIVTLALTVALVAAVNRITGFNVFTLTLWSVTPAGAILTGAAAASGIHLGSRLFQTRPTWLLHAVAGAALAPAAIYYDEYLALVLGNGFRVADRVGFLNYLDLRLTTSYLQSGQQAKTVDPGALGYGLALFQFLGFILGSLGTSIFARKRPACASCSHHLDTLATGAQHFNDQDAFDTYYENVLNLPLDGPEFADWMAYDPDRMGIREGSIRVTFVLQCCPHCRTQVIEQTIQIRGSKDWTFLPKFAQVQAIPSDIDLKCVFRDQAGRTIMQEAA